MTRTRHEYNINSTQNIEAFGQPQDLYYMCQHADDQFVQETDFYVKNNSCCNGFRSRSFFSFFFASVIIIFISKYSAQTCVVFCLSRSRCLPFVTPVRLCMPRKKCGDRDYIVILLCVLIFMQVVFFRLNTIHPVTKIFFCYLNSWGTVFFSFAVLFGRATITTTTTTTSEVEKKEVNNKCPENEQLLHINAWIYYISRSYLRNVGNNISQNNAPFYYS